MYGDGTPLTSESSSAEPAKLAVEDCCVRDIDAWITVNKLKMNRDKTELVVLTASHRQPSPLTSISVCDEVISKSSVATILVTNLETLPGGGTLGISGWGCAAGTLEPLTYTRATSAEFCYPILE